MSASNCEPIIPTLTLPLLVMMNIPPYFSTGRKFLQSPSRAIFVVQILVGLRQIRNLEIPAVPGQTFAAHTNGNRSQQNRLGQRTGEAEIGTCLASSLAV